MPAQPALSAVPLAEVSSANPAPPARRGLAMRLAFVLGCVVVYRLGTYIPLPGIDADALARMPEYGRSHLHLSIVSLGIVPYISASFLMQLVVWGWRGVAALTETRAGRRRINGYIRGLTVVLAAAQAIAVADGVKHLRVPDGGEAVLDSSWLPQIAIVVTLIAGAMFVVWLSEQISERDAGDGVMVILLVTIIAELPVMLVTALEELRIGRLQADQMWPPAVLLAALIAVVVFFETARRRLPVRTPAHAGQTRFLPLKLNGSGIVPYYLAPSLALLPLALPMLFQPERWAGVVTAFLAPGQHWFLAVTTLLILPLAFLGRMNGFNPNEAAAHLKKSGGSIPGVDADKTAAYAGYVLARVSAVGALYLAAVYAAAELLIARAPFLYLFHGTTLLLAVLVTLDIRAAVAGGNSHADERMA